LAGNQLEAKQFARAQNLSDEDWFFPVDEDDLRTRSNFHVLVIGTAGNNVPESYFNRLYDLAQSRGRINRG
jgi:hypothetical protein